MKIIDLFVKILKGEKIPEKIIINGDVFIRQFEYFVSDEPISEYYINENGKSWIFCLSLNDEVEILEEDTKLEKTKLNYLDTNALYDRPTLRNVLHKIIEDQQRFTEKINELIDEVNKLKGEK